MSQELPYSECYAVISAGRSFNYHKLSVNVRNPDLKSCFRSDYELAALFWFDRGYEKPCGDGVLGLEANGSILPSHKVSRALASLRSYERKLVKVKAGYDVVEADSMAVKIWCTLLAAGVTEVRIHTEVTGYFPGWDNIEVIKITGNKLNAFIEVCRKLEILEAKCWEGVGK